MRIQNNGTAVNTHRSYTLNNDKLAVSAERLSSGYRINRAGDDAAGLAISEKMRAQIRGLAMAVKNCRDGSSLIQTAEGALSEVQSALQRMNELAVQSATGTNEDLDRTQLAKEYEQLKREIDDISVQTTFNNMRLLDGSLSAKGVRRGAYSSGVYKTFLPAVPDVLPGGIKNIKLTEGTPYAKGATAGLSTAATSAYCTFDFNYAAASSGDTLKIGKQTYVFYKSSTDGAPQIDGAFMLDLDQITSAGSLADAIGTYDTLTGAATGAQADSSITSEIRISAKAIGGDTVKITYAGDAAAMSPNTNSGTGGIYGTKSTKYVAVEASHTNIPKAAPSAGAGAPGAAQTARALAEDGAAYQNLDTQNISQGEISPLSLDKARGVTGITGVSFVGGLDNQRYPGADSRLSFVLDFGDMKNTAALKSGELVMNITDAGNKTLATVTNLFDMKPSATTKEFVDQLAWWTTPDGGHTHNGAMFQINRSYFGIEGAYGDDTKIQFACFGTDINNLAPSTSFSQSVLNTAKFVITTTVANALEGTVREDVYDVTTISGQLLGMRAYSHFQYNPGNISRGDILKIGDNEYTFYDTTKGDAAPAAYGIDISKARDAAGLANEINKHNTLKTASTILAQAAAENKVLIGYNGTLGYKECNTMPMGGFYGKAGNQYVKLEFTGNTNPPPDPPVNPPNPPDPPTPPTPPNPPAPSDPPSVTPPSVSPPKGAAAAAPLGVTTFELDASKIKAGDKISYLTDDGTWLTHTFKNGDKEADIMRTLGVLGIAQGSEWRLYNNIDQRYRLVFEPAAVYTVSAPLKIQVGALEGQQLAIKIDAMNTSGLKLDASNIYTQQSAGQAITATRGAINAVSEQRAYLGAMQNRLSHKTANLNVSIENLRQAESRIRDTDIALEMSAFTKNSVLAQAATAMLAQANSAPQNVLALLR